MFLLLCSPADISHLIYNEYEKLQYRRRLTFSNLTAFQMKSSCFAGFSTGLFLSKLEPAFFYCKLPQSLGEIWVSEQLQIKKLIYLQKYSAARIWFFSEIMSTNSFLLLWIRVINFSSLLICEILRAHEIVEKHLFFSFIHARYVTFHDNSWQNTAVTSYLKINLKTCGK